MRTRIMRRAFSSLAGILLVLLGLLGLAVQPAASPAAASVAARASGPGAPQEQAPEPDDVDEEPDSDASPRGSMRHYLEACREGDHATAARYLDLSQLPPAQRTEVGPVLAARLKVVLDRTLWMDLEGLSASPEGDLDDGLGREVERVGTMLTSRGEIEVRLRRATDEAGEPLWRFPAAFVARIPALYDEFGYGWLGEVLPEYFFTRQFLGLQLWQWIGILLLVVAAYPLSWLLVSLLYAALRPLAARTATGVDDEVLRLTVKPVRFALAVAVFAAGILFLRLALPVHHFFVGLEKGLVVVAVAWLFLRVVDLFTAMLRTRLLREGKLTAMTILPLGERSVKVLLLAFAFIVLVQNLGFNVTGLIAGLGVGGLAVALAAQKTVENLFGGVSLILDQPVRVGDFCRYGDQTGTVEDIGLRSTKVRTLERTLVSIPNSDFAQMALENFARREKFLFKTNLGLRYETTPDQMRCVLAEVRRLLLSHPRVDPDPARVRFVGYGSSSLDLEVFAYVPTADANEFLAVREDLLLRIMDIVEQAGTGFAFPSTTTYFARDGGIDRERTREAEERVRAWRERGELPFPDYAPGVQAEFDDTIEYPPRGSALRRS